MFCNIEIKKNRFYHQKTPYFLRDVDIQKLLVSKKIYFGEKTINTLLFTCTIIIKLSLYKSNRKLHVSLLIITEYYTMNSIKPF